MDKGELRVVPLGGLGEIGMNCLILEAKDEMIVIDCGIMFSDLEHFGIEYIAPKFDYILERKEKLKAILITHGHEDHIGALGIAHNMGIRVPIYSTPFTRALIVERVKELGILSDVNLVEMSIHDTIAFDSFSVKVIPVNHSIVESLAFIIDTPIGKVVHTGDFRIDTNPFYGNPLDLSPFKEASDDGVTLLLSDSTNVEFEESNRSEDTVYTALDKIFMLSKGMTIVSMFASNISRMGQIVELAKKQKKRIVLSGRSMEQNFLLAMESGYLKDADSVLTSVDEIDSIEREKRIILATGSQGEYRSSLARISLGEHKRIKLEPEDTVIFSSKFIPGNEKAIGRTINNLFKQGAEVIYDAVEEVHVSGHATRPELKKMLETVCPKFFIPVHGEYRHLKKHADLAKECGVKTDNIGLLTNGDIGLLSKKSFSVIDRLEETKMFFEDRSGKDVPKSLLKERRNLASKGIIFVSMVKNKDSGNIIAGPEISARGVVAEELNLWLEEELLKRVKNTIRSFLVEYGESYPIDDLRELIRIDLRRFTNLSLGKKPIVIPIVIEA